MVSNGCFGSVSCEKARQLFRFKTINTVICPKTVVGRLDEQQNDEFPAASSSWLRPSISKTCWALQSIDICMLGSHRS